MAIKDIVKGICSTSRCKYDVYTKDRTDELLGTKANANVTVVKTTETDLNDYKETGTYYFTSSVIPTNIPVGVNGWLIVMNSGGGAIKQMWYRCGTAGSNDYHTYVRTYVNDIWSEWKRFVTEDDVNGVTLWEGNEILSSKGIALSQAITNFETIRIYYGISNKYNSVDVPITSSTTSAIVSLQDFDILDAGNGTTLTGFSFYFYYAKAKLESKKLSVTTPTSYPSENQYGAIRVTDKNAITCESGNSIKVYKVVGYKY